MSSRQENEEPEQRLIRLAEIYRQLKKTLQEEKTATTQLNQLKGEQMRLEPAVHEAKSEILDLRSRSAPMGPVLPNISAKIQQLSAILSQKQSQIPSLQRDLQSRKPRIETLKSLIKSSQETLEKTIPEALSLSDPFGRLPSPSHSRCQSSAPSGSRGPASLAALLSEGFRV